MKENAIFEGLNAEQKSAVSCVEGPVLIVAGAGSGKTRVLTSRIANILDKDVDPSRIMALTFTKKAATEMKERIALMVGGYKARRIFMGTFHSIFIRFLREYASMLGYPEQFTIYDTSDSTSAIKACIKELSLDDKVYKPKDVLSRISLAKNNLLTEAAYRANTQIITNDTHARKPRICDIYSLYASKCRQAGVMDFDDILLNMNILLRDHPDALEAIASRFDYLLVDEYQDTNFSQYLILKKLSQFHSNICVVGDDSQSIYSFRGAKIENILNFKKDYPNCHIFRLERNYRSTSNIVNAANSLIAKNENRIPKTCVAVGEEGDKIKLLNNFSEQEEALRISSEIVDRMQFDKCSYRDFAILYRTNSQSRALEEALRKRNLPYRIYSGHSFYERAEVKIMLAYLKLVVNVNDDESFKKTVNEPARGIGETSLNALGVMARAMKVSLFKAAYSENFAEYGLKAPAVAKIRSFCEMINIYAAKQQTTQANELVTALSNACGLYAHYKADTSIESQSRASNVEELLNSTAQFVEDKQNEYIDELKSENPDLDESTLTFPIVTLGEFLENISLLSNIDIEDDQDSEDADNKIALMTVHSSKGLEFPYVFVAGLEENVFPLGGVMSSSQDIEEERRLFYVAMTRAKKSVYLSFAKTRMKNGKHESNSPSRFIKEIDTVYIDNPLTDEDYERSSEFMPEGAFRFSGFGSRTSEYGNTKYGGSKYGMSGDVKRIPNNGSSSQSRPSYPGRSSSPFPSRPGSQSRPGVPSQPEITSRPVSSRPLPPKIPDAEFVPTPIEKLAVGQRIEHNRFGLGVINEISGVIPELKAKVAFDDYGEKLLLLKYAKIRIK